MEIKSIARRTDKGNKPSLLGKEARYDPYFEFPKRTRLFPLSGIPYATKSLLSPSISLSIASLPYEVKNEC